MAASPPETRALLQAGITALRRGDRAEGRNLLLQVIELDERQELAWVWLSEAVDDPADAQLALENALAINPDNAGIRRRLEHLRALRPPAAPPAPPEPAPPEPAPDDWGDRLAATGIERDDDGLDDPLQCLACGRPTQETDRQCAHCGQALFERIRRSNDSEFLRVGRLVLTVLTGLAVAQLSAAVVYLNALREGTADGLRILLDVPGARLALGGLFSQDWLTMVALVAGLGLRGLLLGLILLAISMRWTFGFYAALAGLSLELAGNLGLLAGDFFGAATLALNAGLALAGLYLIGASYQEFTVTWERRYTAPNPQARTAGGFAHLGQAYGQAGLWALAVAQWRKAVGLAPREVAYYKQLGLAYARIRRYARSLQTLEEAGRRAPQDPTIREIIALVREQAARETAAPPRPPQA